MPNAIKYSTTGDTLSLKKGNIYFGVGDVGKGPSSATTYYNGVTPPADGYTIYSYNASQTSKLSFHTAVNDSALITYTNGVSGQNFSTATQCLNWYATQSNYVCVNRDYEGIVTNGLVLNVDAGFTPSYPTSGTTWYDLSYSGNNGTLTNGPTFSSLNGGSIVFDGVDDFTIGTIPSSTFTGPHTICCWFYRETVTQWSGLFSNNVNSTSCSIFTFINSTNSLGTNRAGVSGTSIAVDLGSDHLNKWIYAVITYGGVTNGSNVNVYAYKDGSLISSSGNLYWDLSTTSSYYVGRHWTSAMQVHDGFIPHVSLYNRALTASEILQNYNAQKSRFGL